MLRELQSHVAATASDGYTALPTAAVRCAAFQETAQALVYDVLMLKVRLPPAHTAALSFPIYCPCLSIHPVICSHLQRLRSVSALQASIHATLEPHTPGIIYKLVNDASYI